MAEGLNRLNGANGLGWGMLFSMLLVGTVLGYLALGELCTNARKGQSRESLMAIRLSFVVSMFYHGSTSATVHGQSRQHRGTQTCFSI